MEVETLMWFASDMYREYQKVFLFLSPGFTIVTMNLVQYQENGKHALAIVEGERLRILARFDRLYDLAWFGIKTGVSLCNLVKQVVSDDYIDYEAVITSGRLLPPIDHVDPAHLLITGTGLSHLGSAATRDEMHSDVQDDTAPTDSMRMFKWGIEGGKPASGEVGVQPEWFYKGDGSIAVPPEADLISPSFALDGGEEPEVAGIYLIGPDSTVYCLGFALANEFSDHLMEQKNYLYLAHSKLRPCSFGPEVRIGQLPDKVTGVSSILRDGEIVWSKPFSSGDANMCHSIDNLEHHHFKYAAFRRPGDVHIHFFGTATLSFADHFVAYDGDQFVIESPIFGKPLRNRLHIAEDHVFHKKIL
jgi:hypothetical protein